MAPTGSRRRPLPSLLRPSLNTLIVRHLKAAKKQFGYSNDLLVEPPNLLGSLARKKTFKPVSQYFQGTPPVLTPEEAEELAGDSWKASSALQIGTGGLRG